MPKYASRQKQGVGEKAVAKPKSVYDGDLDFDIEFLDGGILRFSIDGNLSRDAKTGRASGAYAELGFDLGLELAVGWEGVNVTGVDVG